MKRQFKVPVYVTVDDKNMTPEQAQDCAAAVVREAMEIRAEVWASIHPSERRIPDWTVGAAV